MVPMAVQDIGAAVGMMMAGPDADGITTVMHTVAGATPAEVRFITTPAMDSMVENPSTVEARSAVVAASTVAVVSTEVGAAKR
jgi:hypothetical protein